MVLSNEKAKLAGAQPKGKSNGKANGKYKGLPKDFTTIARAREVLEALATERTDLAPVLSTAVRALRRAAKLEFERIKGLALAHA